METENIKYPYLPEGRTILYVPRDNKYMLAAKKMAEEFSTDKKNPTGVVVVDKDGKILVSNSNQSAIKNKFLLYTHKNWCIRKFFKISTGQHYWLCPGCASSKYHAESLAVEKAKESGINISDCDLYLWGHWWCCKPCWDKIISAGIKNIYLTN